MAAPSRLGIETARALGAYGLGVAMIRGNAVLTGTDEHVVGPADGSGALPVLNQPKFAKLLAASDGQGGA